MKKNLTELPPDMQAELRALADKPDEEINTDDIPEILDWSGGKRGMFYRPVKRQITLRLDSDVVAWFKARADGGRGYQTDINSALREHVHRFENAAGRPPLGSSSAPG